MAAPLDLVTRFAPSPTGHLHLGHAYAALFAQTLATRTGGRFLVRIEDIDTTRSKPAFEADLLDDLDWLGLSPDGPIVRQSDRFEAYRHALHRLERLGLTYPCFCTRRDIAKEIANSHAAPHPPREGPEGPIYPGTCREMLASERAARLAAGEPHAIRLDTAKALAYASVREASPLGFREALVPTPEGRAALWRRAEPELFGDVVLARKDVPTSYHLAVVLDDAAAGIDVVTRGRDLYHASHIHRLLQALFDLNSPIYAHHRLIEGQDGNRLATRDKALSLRTLRAEGYDAAAIKSRLPDPAEEVDIVLKRLEAYQS